MRQSRILFAVLLVMVFGLVALAGQGKKDKKVVGGGGLDDTTPNTSTIKMVSKYGMMILGGVPEKAQIFLDDVELNGATIQREAQEESPEAAKPGSEAKPQTEKANLEVKPAEEATAKLEKVSISRILVGKHKLKIVHPDYIDWAKDD